MIILNARCVFKGQNLGFTRIVIHHCRLNIFGARHQVASARINYVENYVAIMEG